MEKRALEDVKEASNTDELKKKLENLKKIEGSEEICFREGRYCN